MFQGLFIGVDRYASPGINWLSCARRDAMALHGLFSDSMGGEAALLTDAEATVAAIHERFQRLAEAEPDDVVVVAFSGHGTDTHEIVAHDTDAQNVARTSIPLTTLGDWCARIRARRLLVILDCCFSGGMGAKALQVFELKHDGFRAVVYIQNRECKLISRKSRSLGFASLKKNLARHTGAPGTSESGLEGAVAAERLP